MDDNFVYVCFRPLYGVPNFYGHFYTKHGKDNVFVPSTGFLISTGTFELWKSECESFRPLYGVPNFYKGTVLHHGIRLRVFVPSTGFLISTLSLIALGKSILFIWFAGQTRKPDIFLSIKFHFLLKMPILQVSAQNYIFWYSILPIPMS